MAWYEKINPFIKTEIKQPSFDDSFSYSPYVFAQGTTSPSDFVNTYGQVGWVFACVSRISSAIAETKWRLYSKKNGNDIEEIIEHPLLELFDFVNPFHTGLEMMEQTQTYIDLTGEVFWLVLKDTAGQPAEIWVMNPNKIKVVPDRKMYIKGYVYKNGNDEIPLSIEDIVHIKLPNPKNPFRGQSPLGSVSSDVEAEKFSSQYNRAFFQNSAEPNGVIQFEGTLTDSQYERLRYQWNRQHQGTTNSHKVAILEGGASWHTNTLTQRDMQFRDLRVMNRDVIMGVYGMPKHILGIAEDVNRANAEASEYTFARWVLKPRLERIKAKLNEQFIPLYNDKTLFIDYDTPVPADIDRNLSIADQGFKSGYITRNEARIKVGLEPMADGDIFMEPLSSQSENVMRNYNKEIKTHNHDSREIMWKAFVDATTPLENEFTDVISNILEQQEKVIIANINKTDYKDEDVFDENNWNEKLYIAIRPLILKSLMKGANDEKEYIEDQANRQRRSITKQEPKVQFGFDIDTDTSEFQHYLDNEGLKHAKGINRKTAKELNAILLASRNEGLGANAVAEKITKRGILSKERALKIARTETVSAVNFGHLQSAKQSQVVTGKRWLAALDESTRETHEFAHRQERKLEQEFIVGGDSMLAPAQGSLPEENINCRCTMTDVLDFDTINQILDQEENAQLSANDLDIVSKDNYSYPLSEARCPQCSKLLGKKVLGTVNLYCNRCKVEIKFSNNKEKSAKIQ
ncbi:MAG: putative portal protein [Prokaryotic dsDNA virus sp.]|nr:MAG: putative portal protein [Prokaryotic dsDNA virus sp.]|tara:strand:- start:321 stop:2555 length:2235 start_codon:yes stop_codon:yes gene_type:complete